MKVSRDDLLVTFRFAFPVIMAQLGQMLFNVVDTAMVGRVSKHALAASGFSASLYGLVMVTGFGLMSVTGPLVSRAKGKGDFSLSGATLRQAAFVAVLSGVLLAFVMEALVRLTPGMGQESRVIELAQPYMRILATTMPFVLLYHALRQFAEAVGFSRFPMIVVYIGNVLNIILNYGLIFGKFGLPRWELIGAGVSTLIVQVCMCVIMITMLARREEFRAYELSLLRFRFRPEILKEFFRLGIPSSLQVFFEVSYFSLAGIMIGWLGATEQAAHQITINTAATAFMIMLGVAFSSAHRVGEALGEGDMVKVRHIGFSSFWLVFGLNLVTGLLLFGGRFAIPRFYTNNTEVMAVASTLLIFAALFQIFDGAQAIGVALLRGLGDTVVPTWITFFAYCVVGLPSCYIFGFVFSWEEAGVWFGFIVGLIVSAVLLVIRFMQKTEMRRQEAA